jgi:hypothetical protein
MDRRTEPPIWPQAAARSCGAREELASGIERRALYATQIRKANHGALTNPLFRCVIVSVPAFCHWSERSPLGPSCCNLQGGLHHAEDSDRSGCILCDAERCRCCRSASQRAAASGSRSGWQVSGRQVSDWQISTSRARRDQGLTVCVLDARKIERPGYASHYHSYAPLRRGISTLTGIASGQRCAQALRAHSTKPAPTGWATIAKTMSYEERDRDPCGVLLERPADNPLCARQPETKSAWVSITKKATNARTLAGAALVHLLRRGE